MGFYFPTGGVNCLTISDSLVLVEISWHTGNMTKNEIV